MTLDNFDNSNDNNGSRGRIKSPLPSDFIRFHGRRKGKTISQLKQSLYEKFMPMLSYQGADFFASSEKNCLEIGFGGGEHLAALAKAHPNTKFLGAEPFINGVTSLIHHLCYQQESTPNNIKIYPDDIRKIYSDFQDESFDEIYLLFPDPWRKSRHSERRFVNEDNILSIHRLLKRGRDFIIASDDPTYILWVDEVMPKYLDRFALRLRTETAPVDWIPTRYEIKALKAGRQPVYYFFSKI